MFCNVDIENVIETVGELIGKIPIFAKTERGFRNLTKLSSKSFLEVEASKPPHCNVEDLLENSDDLIGDLEQAIA